MYITKFTLHDTNNECLVQLLLNRKRLTKCVKNTFVMGNTVLRHHHIHKATNRNACIKVAVYRKNC